MQRSPPWPLNKKPMHLNCLLHNSTIPFQNSISKFSCSQILHKMISPRKLIKLARKWQRIAAHRRKRISLPGFNKYPVADKGHFVVYTTDQKRFVFPISYLSNHIFQELLKMSAEEFGLPSNGPITLPCDASVMEYVLSFIKSSVDRNMEEALVMSIASSRCSLSHSLHGQTSQQLLMCSC